MILSILSLGLFLLASLVYRLHKQKTTFNLPPGPRSLPIVGSPSHLPPPGEPEYQHWLKFKDLYGPVSSLTVLGRTMVILHDEQAMQFLLKTKSVSTSNRPVQPFADLCGFGAFLSSLQYGDAYRRSRKMINRQMGNNRSNARQWAAVQDVESRRLLLRTLSSPDDLINHFKTQSSAVILKITYGYSIGRDDTDRLVHMIEKFMDQISLAYVPLLWAVDVFPWLAYLPDWFPGTGFKKTAKEWRQLSEDVANLPYAAVRRQMAKGTHRPSYVSLLVEEYSGRDGVEGLSAVDETIIKNTAAIMYGGGADTTSSVMTCFLLAMVLYPDVQKNAQEEIDRTIGSATRLPELYDRSELPYVNAIVKECHRWFPIVPMGQCHVATKDLTYGGYDIPKDSFLLPARWWFLHDPVVYSNPEVFEPKRFLKPQCEPDSTPHQFGYGRRGCPGQYIASDTLFLTMARLLATFEISKAVDDNGRELEVNMGSRSGIIDCPPSFPYAIHPRSKKHIELIVDSQTRFPWENSDSPLLYED